VRLNPSDFASAILLAVALADQGRPALANQQLKKIEDRLPAQPQAWRMLGQAWLKLQDPARATLSYQRALRLSPNDLSLRTDLGVAYQLQGDGRSSAEQFEVIVTRDPSDANAANNLAWIYATDNDETVRNGARAVDLAEQACRLTDYQQPVFLGTLSAAYAEAGRLDEAVRTIQRAVDMAQDFGQDALAADLQRRSDLHVQGLPYHQPSKTAAP
jgi:tetratricopeptide (TPR) repeat protein